MSDPVPATLSDPRTQQTGTFHAAVKVMLKRAILDPQGRATKATLKRLGAQNIGDVRIGKVIELTLSGERSEVEAQLQDLIERVLSNPVMEEAVYTLSEVPQYLEAEPLEAEAEAEATQAAQEVPQTAPNT